MAEHQHEWRQHCPKRVCGWESCRSCGAITNGKVTIHGAKTLRKKT